MDYLRWLLLGCQVLTFVYGRHTSVKDGSKLNEYRRQMIIPNKFIPMLKESALFKSRSSSNDLSDFLKPKTNNAVKGQTRQNLMNEMGIDAGPSEGPGGMGPSEMGPGGMGPGRMGGGIGAMGGSEDMGTQGGMGGEGGFEGLAKMGGGIGGSQGNVGAGGMGDPGGMGSPGGMNDQMNAMMNGMGGMPNSEGGTNPLESQSAGNNVMNSMNNVGSEGMMSSDPNNAPAGDPMGAMKAMLDNQGTNAALGAYGPGGSANENVLAMLNQIVGKEMPGDSPVDPSSRSQQQWDQLQNKMNNQRAAVQSIIDAQEAKSAQQATQQDAAASPAPANPAPTNPAPTNKPAPGKSVTPANSKSAPAPKLPVYNLSHLAKSSKSSTANQPKADTVNNGPPGQTESGKSTSTTSTKLKTDIHSQKENHEDNMSKATSDPAEIEVDDDQPLPEDMVKFLKGVKFVVSQEPGNDIILGKKFTGHVPFISSNFKEENGVMKNTVSAKEKKEKGKSKMEVFNKEHEANAFVKGLNGMDLSYARTLLLRRDANIEDSAEYRKAAKVLASASKKLTDPIAKKSTEIAISSILKLLALQKEKQISPSPTDNLLNGDDAKIALSEKYFEAARVLGTASKKLVDPVAKKSAEIGIASILKVITLGKYSVSKKNSVPSFYHIDNNENYTPEKMKRGKVAADEIAHKL